jgi:fumarate hydratase class II
MKKMRTEKDTLGEKKIPEEAYYGIQTDRARENFPVSSLRLPRLFIRAQGIIKLAACKANTSVGMLDNVRAQAIISAAYEVIEGKFDDHFIVDVYQAGAGTSQNMNANEVIANRALEVMGKKKGDYSVIHPNDHVNMGQSTNDTIPTAIYISASEAMTADLMPVLENLVHELEIKGKSFQQIVKSGRTHLQDAVPMTLGQEFEAYAQSVERDINRLVVCSRDLLLLPLGGNAVGTGINTHPDYAKKAIMEVANFTGIDFVPSHNFFEGIQNVNPALNLSSGLRGLAVTLTKIANDIRLLSSGPRTGIAEIVLPPVQPGSSIMPGKVNPVMAEMLNMVCFQIIGNDTTIAYATQAAQLELNVMMPVIAYNLLQSISLLTQGIKAFITRCLRGLTADEKQCAYWMEQSLALATALNPIIGYAKAAEISKEAYKKGKTIKEIVREKGIIASDKIDDVLDPLKLTRTKK